MRSQLFLSLSIGLLLGLIGCGNASQNVAGMWEGSTKIHRPPTGNTGLDQKLEKLNQEVAYTLELRKDFGYTETMGLPGAKPDTIKGKWSTEGRIVTLTPASINDRDAASVRTEAQTMMHRLNITLPMPEGSDGPKYLTVSADGSTISMPSIGSTAELKRVAAK